MSNYIPEVEYRNRKATVQQAILMDRTRMPAVLGQASFCKFCNELVVWDVLFGKRHPFNKRGDSHMDTCPNWKRKRLSLSLRADLDTYYRNRWRWMYFRDSVEYEKSAVILRELPFADANWLAHVLCWYGGPCSSWDAECVLPLIYTGRYRETGFLSVVGVDRSVFQYLRRCLTPDAYAMCRDSGEWPDFYHVGGLYLVQGDEAIVCRSDDWEVSIDDQRLS